MDTEYQKTFRQSWQAIAVALALALGFAFPPGAWAADGDGAANGEETEGRTEEQRDGEQQDLPEVRGEILVTSTIPELTAERRIPRAEIESAGDEDLAEMFRGMAGASAVRRGPVNLEPTVRGLQEEQVATFVDGTRTFAAGPGRMDSNISHVGRHQAQGLRVVKGPYALTWGAGSLSAVELETFRPSFSAGGFEWHGETGAGYGENASSLDAYGNVWGSGEKLRFFLGLGRREGDDYEAGDGSLVPGDYESSESRWRLGYRPTERWLLEYSGGYQEQFDIDYPGRLLDATYFYARSHAAEATWTPDSGTVSEVSARLYANRKDHLMNNDEKPTAVAVPGRIPPFGVEVRLPTESNTTGGRLRVDGARGNVDWSLGVDHYRVEQNATRTISRRSNGQVLFEDVVWPDAEIEDLGGYGQLVFGRGRYRIGATLRVDAVDASAGELSDFFLANTAGSPDQSESHLSAAVSATVELGRRFTLEAGVGRAERTATVLERYSDRFPATKFQIAAEFLGNPELDPETSYQLDLGLRGTAGELLIEVSGFYRVIDDYVTVVPDPSIPRRLPLSPSVVYRYVNGTEATFYGGELLLSHRFGERFSWRATLGYVHAQDEALDEPVLGIPPLHGDVAVSYRSTGHRLGLELAARFADRQDRVAVSRFEQETPGYTVYDLSAEVRIADRFTVRGGVENLTDRAYSHHLDSPNPFTGERIREIGRSFRLGFAVDF